jgi:hypothetical protein
MSQTNEETVMFAVMVKPEARREVCEDGKFWVKDETHEYYVTEKDRGLWKSKDDAEKAITESWEEIVEVKKTNEEQITTPEQRIDEALDSVLRASGTSLNHYRTRIHLEGMRKAMRKVMSDSYIAGSNDAMKIMSGVANENNR